MDLARLVAKYSGPIRLHVVNFTDIQLYIYDQCPHDELTIIMRRYMMRIAEHFAKKTVVSDLSQVRASDRLQARPYRALLLQMRSAHFRYIVR